MSLVANPNKKIIVYGGAFNPPHWGHLACLFKLAQLPTYDQILIVPSSPNRPDKSSSTTPALRLLLCQALIEAYFANNQDNRVREILLEPIELDSTAAVRGSWELLQVLEQKYATKNLTLAIGSDLLADLENWRHPEKIKRVPLIVLKRAGYPLCQLLTHFNIVTVIDDELPNISSSAIRAALSKDTNTINDLRKLVPAQVADILLRHNQT